MRDCEEDGDSLPAVVGVWLVLGLGARLRRLCCDRAGPGGAADEQGDAIEGLPCSPNSNAARVTTAPVPKKTVTLCLPSSGSGSSLGLAASGRGCAAYVVAARGGRSGGRAGRHRSRPARRARW